MITIFRKIRQDLLVKNKTKKYLLYATGEILLVVIGILIALQINNQNELNNTRDKELRYLANIKIDLQQTIGSLEEFIATRKATVQSAGIVLDHFEGIHPVDLNQFNLHNLNVLVWFPFEQHNNTYQELINSGNLALISSKQIRNKLQDMQSSFTAISFIENEMQQDYETYLYDIYFDRVNLRTAFRNYELQLGNPGQTPDVTISPSDISVLSESQKYKNGMVLSVYNSDLLVTEYTNMIQSARQLTVLIDAELARN